MSTQGKSWKLSRPRKPWTSHEDALVSDRSKTALELSKIIDRTAPAIKTRRRQLSGAIKLSHATKPTVLPKFHEDWQLIGKTCLTCFQFLPRDSFGMQSNGTSRMSYCRRCKADQIKARREADPIGTSEESRRSDRLRQAKSLPKATNYGKEWTGVELELISRQELSSTQLADMLGRTVYAIRSQRFLLRKNKLKSEVAGVTTK